MKASDLFVKCLEEEGIEYIFGVPIENIPFETKNLKQCEAILVDNQYPEFFGYSEIPQYSGIKRHITKLISQGKS